MANRPPTVVRVAAMFACSLFQCGTDLVAPPCWFRVWVPCSRRAWRAWWRSGGRRPQPPPRLPPPRRRQHQPGHNRPAGRYPTWTTRWAAFFSPSTSTSCWTTAHRRQRPPQRVSRPAPSTHRLAGRPRQRYRPEPKPGMPRRQRQRVSLISSRTTTFSRWPRTTSSCLHPHQWQNHPCQSSRPARGQRIQQRGQGRSQSRAGWLQHHIGLRHQHRRYQQRRQRRNRARRRPPPFWHRRRQRHPQCDRP